MSIFIELPIQISHTRHLPGGGTSTETKMRPSVINLEDIRLATRSLDTEGQTLIIWRNGTDSIAGIPYESFCDITRPVTFGEGE